jgi:hypothetical protein
VLEDAKTIVDIIGTLITASVVIVGGLWTYFRFVKGRTFRPRLEVGLLGQWRSVDDKKTLHAGTAMKNIGGLAQAEPACGSALYRATCCGQLARATWEADKVYRVLGSVNGSSLTRPSPTTFGWSRAMSDQIAAPPGGVPLADAIAALRVELFQAWVNAQNQQLKFRVSPIELTLQTAVTRTGKGMAGIKWWLLDVGAEASRAGTTTQTIKLSLDPVTLDAEGNVVSVFIDAPDVPAGAGQSEGSSSAEPSFDAPG